MIHKVAQHTGNDVQVTPYKSCLVWFDVVYCNNDLFLYLVESDIFHSKYDLVVSNPPYISTCELSNLSPEILK